MREDEHEDGAEEGNDGEEGGDELARVPLTGEPPSEIMSKSSSKTLLMVSVTKTHIRHSSSDCGIICPVLREHLDLKTRIKIQTKFEMQQNQH